MPIVLGVGQARWEPWLSLLGAAGLAVWLLLQPALIQGLPFMLRLPAVVLGVWALGAGFLRPLVPLAPRRWPHRATSPPWNLVALGLFSLLLLARSLPG